MALGNNIVVSGRGLGLRKEGTTRLASLPGTMMQIDVSEAAVNNRFQWEPYDQSFNAQMGLVAILLPDRMQGKIVTDAYTALDRCFLYCPLNGEEMNVLLHNVTGTADDVVLGDRLIVVDGEGTFITTTGTAADKSEPFVALEAITDPTADQLIHVMFTGY